jgi:hypothetical protein
MFPVWYQYEQLEITFHTHVLRTGRKDVLYSTNHFPDIVSASNTTERLVAAARYVESGAFAHTINDKVSYYTPWLHIAQLTDSMIDIVRLHPTTN